jgi:hypothetical protein
MPPMRRDSKLVTSTTIMFSIQTHCLSSLARWRRARAFEMSPDVWDSRVQSRAPGAFSDRSRLRREQVSRLEGNLRSIGILVLIDGVGVGVWICIPINLSIARPFLTSCSRTADWIGRYCKEFVYSVERVRDLTCDTSSAVVARTTNHNY